MRFLAKHIDYSPDKPIKIVAFSDLHIGHAEHSLKYLRKFLQPHLEDPNTYFLGLGDHIDCIIPSDLKRFDMTTIHPDMRQDLRAGALLDLQVEEFCRVFEPIRDRIIGLTMGNHEANILRRYGTDCHARICDRLRVENLGYSFLMVLVLRMANPRGRVRTVRLFGHHGWGGASRTQGGQVTKFARAMEQWDADVYLFGHSHDLWSKTIPRVGVNNRGKVVHRDIIVANTGTFKKTLNQLPIPSWEETKGFPPRMLGGVVLEIQPEVHGWVKMSVKQ